MKKPRFFFCLMLTLCLVCSFSVPISFAQVEEKIDTKEKRDVVLYRGDLVALKVYSLTRIAISTPGVVDIVNADVDEILLIGKSLGQTQIFIWDELGKRSVLARVMEQDLTIIMERIEQLLELAEISGIKLTHSAYEGKIIATGKVNKVQKEEFDTVIEELGEYVINMVDEQGDLIQIDAQIVQMDLGWEKTFGIKWTNLTSWTFSKPVGKFQEAFRFGTYGGSNEKDITAVINAAISELHGKALSKPSITVSDGEEANISVGGEVPISEPTTNENGSTTYSVVYKPWGIQLSVTPEIKDDDKIDVQISVSNSTQTGTTVGDSNVISYAFTTTSAQTKVLLDDGQTIVIAGLLEDKDDEVITEVPFLRRIPFIGSLLFKHKTHTRKPQKEVIITLTPRIRRQKNKLKTNQEVQKDKELKEEAAINLEQADGSFIEFDEDGLMLKQQGDEILTAEPLEEINQEEEGLEEKSIDDILDDIEDAVSSTENLNIAEDVSAEVSDYAKSVQRKIASKISFPFQAKEEGWEGTTVLSLTIFSDGSLNDAKVEASSGYSVFDSDAVNTAEIVAPFEPFPVELEMDELTILIPVTYNQEAFLLNS